MGDAVNVFLDNLDAFLWRILQLPIVFQLLMWFVVAAVFWWIFLSLLRIKVRKLDKRARLIWFCIAVATSLLIASGVIIDRKWKMMEEEMSGFSQTAGMIVSGTSSDSDLLSLADSLKVENQDDSIRKEWVYVNEGLQVIRLSFRDPEVVVYLAAIDLPRYEVLLDTAISVKEKTTSFAQRYDAEIAVNGEAGSSPGMDAPLGRWKGNYIVKGDPLMLKDNDERPFVYFNMFSKAGYSTDPEVIDKPGPEMYNAIWGRFDLILNGKIDIDKGDMSKMNRYPRTVVGIDSTGLRLFLMVVDGRRPQYSAGLTMKQCGQILLPFGVYQAMACDQGGSTNMYVKGLGIINRPADGVERPVYTHLGLRSRY